MSSDLLAAHRLETPSSRCGRGTVLVKMGISRMGLYKKLRKYGLFE